MVIIFDSLSKNTINLIYSTPVLEGQIPVESKINADIEIKDETVRTVVDAALDVLSAPTEMLGWLGDSIRVHRARAALRCFNRTKEIAEESGIKLKAPPIKFISQYIEYASLEDDMDDELIEWWARILVDAGSNYKEKHIFFTNVLKQVSAVELELLETIVRNGRTNYRIELATEAELKYDFQYNDDELKLTNRLTDITAHTAINSILNAFEIPGALVLDIFIDDEHSNQWQEFHPDYAEEELASWQILQSLQLARIDFRTYRQGKVHYRIRLVVLTQLGSEFYFSCHDKALAEAMSEDVRFVRKLMPTDRITPN